MQPHSYAIVRTSARRRSKELLNRTSLSDLAPRTEKGTCLKLSIAAACGSMISAEHVVGRGPCADKADGRRLSCLTTTPVTSVVIDADAGSDAEWVNLPCCDR